MKPILLLAGFVLAGMAGLRAADSRDGQPGALARRSLVIASLLLGVPTSTSRSPYSPRYYPRTGSYAVTVQIAHGANSSVTADSMIAVAEAPLHGSDITFSGINNLPWNAKLAGLSGARLSVGGIHLATLTLSDKVGRSVTMRAPPAVFVSANRGDTLTLMAGGNVDPLTVDRTNGVPRQIPVVVVSADEGGIKRALGHATRLGVPLAIVDKRRTSADVTRQENVMGASVKGKVAFISTCLMV